MPLLSSSPPLNIRDKCFSPILKNISLEPVLRQGWQYRKMVLIKRFIRACWFFLHFVWQKVGRLSLDSKKSIFFTTSLRSKRRGFVHYTMGQLKAIGTNLFKLELSMEVKDQEVKFDTVHVTFAMTFDNRSTVKAPPTDLVAAEARLPALRNVAKEYTGLNKGSRPKKTSILSSGL